MYGQQYIIVKLACARFIPEPSPARTTQAGPDGGQDLSASLYGVGVLLSLF